MAKKKSVIITRNGKTEVFATMAALCKAKGWPYHKLRIKETPFIYEGNIIEKKEILR
jgi:ribosomal protein L7Ae-like RNA K-turn-binding protein